MQEALVGAADVIIPKERRRGKKDWMTEKILDMMEERRRLRIVSHVRYKELDIRIKRMCKQTKEEWLNLKCR